MRIRSLLALASMGSLASMTACGGSHPTPQSQKPVGSATPSTSAVATTPEPPKARWVETGSYNAVGPATSQGTLVLLGGRRAVVAPDGSLRTASGATPEPIVEYLEVPTASGARLVGRGEQGLYRFDDPLGAPTPIAHTSRWYSRAEPGPGVVAVWGYGSDLPTFVDVQAGTETKLAGLPTAPLLSIAFRDAKVGAAIFAGAGLTTTSDGGVTWKPAAADANGYALKARTLGRRDGVVLVHDTDGVDRSVDFAGGTVEANPPTPTPPGKDAPALVRWLARTHRDPLEAAIADGVAVSPTQAIAIANGLVARVDLATGGIVELLDLATADQRLFDCSIRRAGTTAWLGCSVARGSEPVTVRSMSLTAPTLKTDETLGLHASSARFRASPSGGLMLTGHCQQNGEGHACVRQPSGKWQSIDAPAERPHWAVFDSGESPTAFGTGPLATGGVAYVTVYKDDEGTKPTTTSSYYAARRPPKIRLAVIEPNGMHRKLPMIALPDADGELYVIGHVEEDDRHALHVLLQDATGPMIVVQPLDGPAKVTRLDDVRAARMRDGRAIAVGAKTLRTSTDGGVTWNVVATTDRLLNGVGYIPTSGHTTQLVVGDVGLRVGGQLHVGWGEAALAEPDAVAKRSASPSSTPTASAPELELQCTSDGAGTGLAQPGWYDELDKLAAFGATPKDMRRSVTHAWSGGYGASTLVSLVEDTSEKNAEQRTWRLYWFQDSEVGAHVHAWTGASPKFLKSSTYVRRFASSGDRFFALLSNGAHSFVVRSKPGAGVETVEIPADFAQPSGEIVLGETARDPAAWRIDTSIVAMAADRGPEVVTSIASDGRTSPILGAPTAAGGVPIYLAGSDWSIARLAPMPVHDKKEDAGAPAKLTAPAASLDGWTVAPQLRRALSTAPACNAKSTGSLFVVSRSPMPFDVDGAAQSGSAFYGVRVNGSAICAASIVSSGYLNRPSGTSSDAAKKDTGPVDYARVDFAAGRAEGGSKATPSPKARRLKCALGPR